MLRTEELKLTLPLYRVGDKERKKRKNKDTFRRTRRSYAVDSRDRFFRLSFSGLLSSTGDDPLTEFGTYSQPSRLFSVFSRNERVYQAQNCSVQGRTGGRAGERIWGRVVRKNACAENSA